MLRGVKATNGWLSSALLAVHLLCAMPAAASSDDYESVLDAALAAQESGDYVRAHELFVAAHTLQPNARTLRAQGVDSYQAGRVARAVQELEQALLHPVKPLDDELRQAVSELIERARARLARVVLQVSPERSRVNVNEDGAALAAQGELTLDGGRHVLRFRAEGYLEQTKVVELSPGSRTLVAVTLVPLPPSVEPMAESLATIDPALASGTATRSQSERLSLASSAAAADSQRRRRNAAWTLGGVALGSLLAAGAVFRAGNARAEAIAEACASLELEGCSVAERDRQIDRAHLDRFEVGSAALLGVSAAALVSSATLAWWSVRTERYIALQGGARSLRIRVVF